MQNVFIKFLFDAKFYESRIPPIQKNPDAIRSWLVLILRSYFFTRFLIIKAEKLCGIYLVFWV